MVSQYFTEKVEHVTSSLFTYILLWATKLRINLYNNPKRNRRCCYGLRTLIHTEQNKLRCRILHCYNMAAASEPLPSPSPKVLNSLSWLWPSSSPSPAFRMGDVIGTESGYCMMSDLDLAEQMEVLPEGQTGGGGACRERRMRRREKREIPPLITLLRETETTQMPWNFTREISDGRLILTAERVRRYEYVEENREIYGRVTMRLVPRDYDDGDGGYCEECGWLMDEEEEEEEEEGVEFESFDAELEGFDEDEEEGESKRCGGLPVSYSAGGLVRSDSFWKGVGDGPSGCLGRPGSVPIMPMTPVM